MAEIKVMKPFIGGEFIESKSEKFNTIYDPSTGHEIAKVPCCTKEEVESADFGNDPSHVDYEKLYAVRLPLLRKAPSRPSFPHPSWA